MTDVPAYITQPTTIANGVRVLSGTNWDLSRGAVETPIVALPEPLPAVVIEAPEAVGGTTYHREDKLSSAAPAATVTFSEAQAQLTSEVRSALRGLDKGVTYVVVGHAASSEKNGELLSRRRGNAVAAQLKRQGFKVSRVVSFGARRPLSANGTEGASRRVEIIERGVD